MRFKVGCRLDYEVQEPSIGLFNLRVARTAQQTVLDERLVIQPDGPLQSHELADSGNRLDRVAMAPGHVTLTYDATVDLDVLRLEPETIDEIPVAALPFETLTFLNPSRYCPSDRLANYAIRLFGDAQRGHLRVTDICNWVHEHVDYVRGSSDAFTSALDTLVDRQGVCRDFAHLGISFCRALGIPARFASSYAWQLQPPDFHAVFEAFLGGRWFLFDATRQAPLDGIIRIGVGRDAADVAFASFHGAVTPGDMQVWIEPLAETTDQRTVAAVTTSS